MKHTSYYMGMEMVWYKVLALAALAMVVMGVVGTLVPIAKAQADVERNRELLKIYRELIKRLVRIVPDIPEALRPRITKIISLTPEQIDKLPPEEVRKFLDMALDLIKELKRLARPPLNVPVIIEKSRVKRALAIAERLMKAYGLEEVLSRIAEARKIVKKGPTPALYRILKELRKRIQEERAKHVAQRISDVAAIILKRLTTRPYPINVTQALDISIRNIQRTILVLLRVKEILRAVNASPTALEAIDRAIENLNGTVRVLSEVKKSVPPINATVARELAKKIMRKHIEQLLSEVNKTVTEIEVCVETIKNISVSMNVTGIDKLLEAISNAVNMTKAKCAKCEELLAGGRLVEALRLAHECSFMSKKILRDVMRAKEVVSKAPEVLDNISREVAVLKEHVAKLEDLVAKLSEKAKELRAVRALAALKLAERILSKVKSIINETEEALKSRDVIKATHMVRIAASMIKRAEKVVRDAGEIVKKAHELLELRIEKIRRELMRLERGIEKAKLKIEEWSSIEHRLPEDYRSKIVDARDLIEKVEGLITEIKELLKEKALDKIEVMLTRVRELMKKLSELIETLEEEIEKFSQELESLSAMIKTAEERLSELCKEYENLKSKIKEIKVPSDVRERMNETEKLISMIKDKLESAKKLVEAGKISEVKSLLSEIENSIKELKSKIENLKKAIEELLKPVPTPTTTTPRPRGRGH